MHEVNAPHTCVRYTQTISGQSSDSLVFGGHYQPRPKKVARFAQLARRTRVGGSVDLNTMWPKSTLGRYSVVPCFAAHEPFKGGLTPSAPMLCWVRAKGTAWNAMSATWMKHSWHLGADRGCALDRCRLIPCCVLSYSCLVRSCC